MATSLNPYYTGMMIEQYKLWLELCQGNVLILILME